MVFSRDPSYTMKRSKVFRFLLLSLACSILHGANYRIKNTLDNKRDWEHWISNEHFYSKQELIAREYLPLAVPHNVPLTKANLLQSEAWRELLEDGQDEKDKVLHSLLLVLSQEKNLAALRGPIAAALYAGGRWCPHGRVYYGHSNARELVRELMEDNYILLSRSSYYDPLIEIFKMGATLEEYGYLPHATPTEAPLRSQYLLVGPWRTVHTHTPISCNDLLKCLVRRYNEGWGTYKELRVPIAAAVCAGAKVKKQTSPSGWDDIVHLLMRGHEGFKRDLPLARLCCPEGFVLEKDGYLPVPPAEQSHASIDDLAIQRAPWSTLKDASQQEKDTVLQNVLRRHGRWLPYDAMRRAMITAITAGASIDNWIHEDIFGKSVIVGQSIHWAYRFNALAAALVHHDAAFVQWLMMHGATINLEHVEITAALHPDKNLCKTMLQKQREKLEANGDRAALQSICDRLGSILRYVKAVEITDILLQHGASVDNPVLLLGHCQDGNHAIVAALIAHVADPFKGYVHGLQPHTPLEVIHNGRFLPQVATSSQTKLQTLRALCSRLSAAKRLELCEQRDSRNRNYFEAEKEKGSEAYEHMCTVIREAATPRILRHREMHGIS